MFLFLLGYQTLLKDVDLFEIKSGLFSQIHALSHLEHSWSISRLRPYNFLLSKNLTCFIPQINIRMGDEIK